MTRIYSLDPVSGEDAEILILGTMPGEKSREIRQYYSHPRNQFCKIISEIFALDCHSSYHGRCQVLIQHRLALWDVIANCELQESSSLDSHILNEKPNAIDIFLGSHTMISKIVFNGQRAHRLFRRYFRSIDPGRYIFSVLYSTSPACTRYSFDEKLRCWRTALRGPSEL